MSQVDLFVLAAEPSGDLQGSKLIAELLQMSPRLKIGAVSGPLMRKLSIETFFPMENLQVMGFIDVFFALPKIIRQFFAIRNKILKLNPKAVVLIDYPGFNLRLERSLRKKKFSGKLIHYICPTVWAWGKKRIPLMQKNLDLLLTFFPFEKSCFPPSPMRIEYVGHPLTSVISFTKKERKNILAIFPGSRTKEIERNLPLQLSAAEKLQKEDPSLQIAISVASKEKEEWIRKAAHFLKCQFVLPGEHYELMRTAKLALAVSGTVTLELALHGTPTIVSYAIRPLDCFLAQKIFRINLPFYCIVNIAAAREVFPEFFGPNLTIDALFLSLRELWMDENKRARCMKKCQKIGDLFGNHNASFESAQIILQSLQ